ncbi:holin [Gordonia phage Switzerland]|uniref:Holin n=2 Tax=Soupsvirus soups TaxID=1982563 RepID=A0A160DGD6_9CAUD|nr:holin [Gordonia phage Rosalind]YP_009269033.1 holin [Gordonia phage KatherineG]YP_009269311.1 holin [Gordonia phage Soups]ASZ73890.1 holin [Gordonia phage ShayRa]AXH47811.1 holin [Gordonia phage LastResort]QDM56189.1 holin [Gordonia phage ReMo]QFP95078.1 holin [Gordonia phage MinecraftSteve]QLF84886.1 holin [Gordonia phage Epsocamisio]QZD98662.1 holin [Gordonia phage Looper]UAJ15505.1 holin [Gordonia Phage Boohoo]UOK18066.1 holin [Gordonia phage Switzerland]UVD39759.1 holin [Gordonia 
MAHRQPAQPLSPRVRQTGYYVGSLLLAVLGIVQLWTSVDLDQISESITGILTLLGATAPAYAGSKLGDQIRSGSI